MSLQSARGELYEHVVYHLRIATEHHVRATRVERDANSLFEFARGEHVRDATGQGVRIGLTAQNGDEREAPGSLERQRFQLFTVGQLERSARAVRQDHAFGALERDARAQHGKERAEPSAGGDEPELAMVGHVVEGEKTLRRRVELERLLRRELE